MVRQRNVFVTEQRVCDQARAVRKNRWLSQLEVETIKRQVENELQCEFVEDAVTEVEQLKMKTQQRMQIWYRMKLSQLQRKS